MPKKIVIIGAGPIGSYTAQLLKLGGYKPLIIEEHAQVGRPLHCTGLVGSRVFADQKVFGFSSSAIVNTINGAVIHYDHHSFAIERKKVAYVLDRERFDKNLSKGLDILYSNRFLGLEKTRAGYIIETDMRDLFADIVIGADGAASVMRKILNLNSNHIYQYKGMQLRIKAKPCHKDMVEVYMKKPFFFWVVPEGDGVVRVGTISDSPYQDLQSFLKDTKIKGKILERFGGLVSLGICPHTVRDNLALVGDAACQLKPLTYGGIYFGLKSAAILASSIKENRLKDYDALWKKELANEIKVGLRARAIYGRLTSKDLKQIFLLLKSHKDFIEQAGDFEQHGRLILGLISKPAFYAQVGGLLRLFFKNLI
ncbi:MAG: NAD(P)/FAD-dependent oxidoreductase [Candidatus Omnitrophica bacterium]|nr:NAD(P)/FAD-dependent oxidoreductase [Candidatus Omnitrophota bacterium]